MTEKSKGNDMEIIEQPHGRDMINVSVFGQETITLDTVYLICTRPDGPNSAVNKANSEP